MGMEYLQYIIPAAALIIVQIIISFSTNNVNNVRHEMTVKEIKADIARLEKKQDKHNQLIERMIAIEESDKAQWSWIDDFKDKVP